MMFKLALSAENRCRRLRGYQQIIPLMQGVPFTDGIMQEVA